MRTDTYPSGWDDPVSSTATIDPWKNYNYGYPEPKERKRTYSSTKHAVFTKEYRAKRKKQRRTRRK